MWGGVRYDLGVNVTKESKSPMNSPRKQLDLSIRGSIPRGVSLESLNDDLLVNIFLYLKSKDLCGLERVSKKFKILANSNALWKPLYENEFHAHVDEESKKGFKYWFKVEVQGYQKSQQFVPSKKKCCFQSEPTQVVTNVHGIQLPHSNEKMTAVERLHDGVKLVMLGEAATGKTTTLLRLHHNTFIPYHDATIGTSFLVEQLIVQDTPIKFNIWDTAGSERYHSLIPMYIRGAIAAVVMYAVDSEDSFEKAKKWVFDLNNTNPKPVIALAGNKVDITEGYVVSKEAAAKFAKENELIFFETSAKTGQNVHRMFITIAKKLVDIAIQQDIQNNFSVDHT